MLHLECVGQNPDYQDELMISTLSPLGLSGVIIAYKLVTVKLQGKGAMTEGRSVAFLLIVMFFILPVR